MAAARHILAIDQGTTSSRAIVFDSSLSVVASAQQEFPQHFPASGWVEHEPEDIWESVLAMLCRIFRLGAAELCHTAMLPPLARRMLSGPDPVALEVWIGVVLAFEITISAWAPVATSMGAIATAVASSLRIRKEPLGGHAITIRRTHSRVRASVPQVYRI